MLKVRKHFLAIAVSAVIAGCGGGGSSVWDNAAPPTASSALRAPSGALAVGAAPSVLDANRLMDFAEAQFNQYFPEHAASLTNEPPFLYRAYSTGIYLGVVVTENPNYILGGVYTLNLGGPGVMTYHGQYSDFITPTPSGGGGGGSNNGCYDLALSDTQGTNSVITYNYAGTITGTQTVNSTVGAMSTFEGHSAREVVALTTGSNTTAGVTVAVNTNNKYYSLRSGDTVTTYGGVSVVTGSASGISFTTTARSVFSPPYTDTQYTLAVGESSTTTQSGTVTTTTSFSGAPFPLPDQVATTNISSTTTTKYLGQESVTVPAGTYNTCKFEVTSPGSASPTTNYVIVGKGLPVKITTTGQVIEATSVKLNGANL